MLSSNRLARRTVLSQLFRTEQLMQPTDNVVHSLSLPEWQGGDLMKFTRQEAGWDWMSLIVRRILAGETIERSTNGEEAAFVLLSGNCRLDWGDGTMSIEGRKSVFDGFPHVLYLPHGNHLVFEAETDCEIAECSVPSNARLEPRIITPADVSSVLRGGENASR